MTSRAIAQLGFVVVAALLLTAGCGRRPGSMQQAVANAVASEPNVAAFEKLFPGSHHFISYYTGTRGPTTWQSRALIHGRYELRIVFEISLDSSGTQVTANGPLRLSLQEFTSADLTGPLFEFGLMEWQALQASGGDLSVLGIQIVTDQPIPNIEKVWRDG